MSEKIRVGIAGYGNLGRGVELAASQNDDIELVGVFSRRDPNQIKTLTGVKAYKLGDAEKFISDIDVMILCGGSATDLPHQTAELTKLFNTVDSFDTHANIPKHFEMVNKVALQNNHVSAISVGWDPGMFSLNRCYGESILTKGKTYTFWGKGVSQGHSDAIRRIEGVLDAKQYTCPVKSAMDEVKKGDNPELTTRQKHTRECFVVAKEGADKARIEKEIVEMPKYFSDYDTTVNFITLDELKKNHSGIPHGGFVIRTGKTGPNLERKHVIEYSLQLDSNPEFTSNILVAYARAVARLANKKEYGCKTVLDIAPALLSPKTTDELRKELL